MKSTLNPLLAIMGFFAAGLPSVQAAITQANGQFNGGGINQAYLQAATQSTEAFGGAASRAVDGNNNGQFGANTVTHSGDGAPNTWQVDLGSVKAIQQINVWNRTDCCPLRLSNFRLGVYDASNVEVWAQNYYTTAGTAVGASEVVNPTAGTAGKFIRVTQLGPNNEGNHVLSLSEVQVFSSFTPALFPNVAINKPAFQTSTAFSGDAGRAVDGNISGNYGDNSVTHTDGAVAPGSPVYWEVDLLGDYSINEILINGRTDCCGDRFGNFRVSIFNDGLEVWGMDNFVGAAGSNLGGPTGGWTTFEDTGGFIATGDKVRYSFIDGRNNSADPASAAILSLAEVQVFGQAIPEPGTTLLTALGILFLSKRRRR